MMELLSKLLASREEGQTMAEYAVILGVITIAVVITLGLLSTAISDALGAVIDVLPS
jgi:Flp pilus assembly pilin Flp